MNTKQTTASHTARRSKSFQTWRDRLNGVTMQKSHIDAFRNIVCPIANGERAHKASNLTQSEAIELMDLARFMWSAGGYLITAEHAAQGLRWLESTGTRKGYDMPRESVELFRRFRWVGVHEDYKSYRTDYAPVYAIELTDGRVIKYHTQAWQSGHGVDWWWHETRSAKHANG